MHPILYPPGEKDFLNNGLAVLTDCTKCLVTEERNGAYTLEMQYPANGRHYDLIAEDCILLAKPNPDDEPQPFRLYKSGLTMSGVTTWYGEHVSYFANDVPIEPIATSQTNPAGAFAKISAAAALENPFTFSTTLSTETSFGLATPTPLKKVLGGVDGSVLDQFGGEYHYNKWKIELLKNRGADRGFVISYGKNLTDISQEKNLTKVTTAIFPFWKSSDDDTLVTLPEKIVVLDGAREYGHVHCKTIDFSQDFTDAPSVDTLRAYAKAYLKTSGIAWRSGSCDNVLGVDGSPTNCTSGKEPFIIQGIECMVGAYEVYADAIFKLESADGVFKITPWICKKASEITNNAIGSAYKALSYSLTPPTSAGWRYISSMGFDPAHPCANFPDGLDANSNTGHRAGFYSENATNALREWQAVGHLWRGTDAALGCASSSLGLGDAWWTVSGRACGTAGNRGEFAA